MGGRKEGGARVFTVVPSDRTGGNGHKPKYRKLHMRIRESFFIMRVVKPWHSLPREAVECPSLEILKSPADMFLGNLL